MAVEIPGDRYHLSVLSVADAQRRYGRTNRADRTATGGRPVQLGTLEARHGRSAPPPLLERRVCTRANGAPAGGPERGDAQVHDSDDQGIYARSEGFEPPTF